MNIQRAFGSDQRGPVKLREQADSAWSCMSIIITFVPTHAVIGTGSVPPQDRKDGGGKAFGKEQNLYGYTSSPDPRSASEKNFIQQYTFTQHRRPV